jgi:hypothetical protein
MKTTLVILSLLVLVAQVAVAQQEMEVVPVLCGENKAVASGGTTGELQVVKACLNRIHGTSAQTLSFFMSDRSSHVYFIVNAKLARDGSTVVLQAYQEGTRSPGGKEMVKHSEFTIKMLPYDEKRGVLTGQLAQGSEFVIELAKVN